MWSHLDNAKTSQRRRSSPIASTVQSVIIIIIIITDLYSAFRSEDTEALEMECQPTLHYNSPPAVVAPDTSDWKTVLGTEWQMPQSRRKTAKQADVVFMTPDLTETLASI